MLKLRLSTWIFSLALCFGSVAFADEMTLTQWQRFTAPNYAQFHVVYGLSLDGMVFSQTFRPSDEQAFSEEILSHEKIQLGAQLSERAYYHCMVWGYHRITEMFGDENIDKLTEDILELCQDHEDVYDIYNVLLSAAHVNIPMSEAEARRRVLEGRERQGDRNGENDEFYQAVREKVSQLKKFNN